MSLKHLRGKLIIIEGLDGAGKNYLLSAFHRHLQEHHPSLAEDFIITGEPTAHSPQRQQIDAIFRRLNDSTPPAPASPQDLHHLAELFIKDRIAHCQQIRQWLAPPNPKIVCSTRYDLSTFVYQTSPKLTLPELTPLFEKFYAAHQYNQVPGTLIPHISFILHAPTSLCEQRIKQRNTPRHFYENQPLSSRDILSQRYHHVASFTQQKDQRHIAFIDGSRHIRDLLAELISLLQKKTSSIPLSHTTFPSPNI